MKKLLSIFLILLILLATLSVNAYSTDNFANGDVDKSTNVDVRDATMIQKSCANLVALDNEQKLLADVDLSGQIDVRDATLVQKAVAGLEELSQIKSTTAQTATQPTTTLPQPTTVPKPVISNNINIYFSNNKYWSNVYCYLYNSNGGTPNKSWPGEKLTSYTTNTDGEKVFNTAVDVSKYDRIIFNNNQGQQTVNTPVNKSSSGFFIAGGSGDKMLPGTYAYTGADMGKMLKTTLTYSTGYNKKIWIWTPADYSASSPQKYKTLYVLDGQNLFDDDHSDGYGGWQVTDAVESMMSNGGRGMIIVGIDNGNTKRDSELTPDIGDVLPQYKSEFSSRTGKAFSDFVVNKVMSYVQTNYNSSTAPQDNAIIGSSSGGLESFYIGMENKDKFGHIGALSPAFALFSTSVWNSYLSKYTMSSADMPRIYIYNGNGDSVEQELYQGTKNMYSKLISSGYSSSKVTLVLEEAACHNEAYWRIIFPEMLTWCFEL